MIMNGVSMEVGSVAAMRYVANGIKAAKLVMEHTEHTMLVGEKASVFAVSMGLPGPTNLSSQESVENWMKWRKSKCQPNFRKNVVPVEDCGPYKPKGGLMGFGEGTCSNTKRDGLDKCGLYVVDSHNHDTISMAVIDKMGCIAVGTSTNGATFKIPGRVGDGAIAGSSAYADAEACDILLKSENVYFNWVYSFVSSYQVVESMRLGMEPKPAAKDAIARIARKYPNFVGAVFAVDKNGSHAGACHGWTFQYSVRGPDTDDVMVYTVNP
ncbi:N(4)-(Beta-n-acetylglucosaminyl)-l-asparaginase [Striga asiatica]|uniref:beta-aspartyl-peptidase n=1 Tax=Striga asiatica TaxID=4170 RepID=A0A5A7QXB0_STRAF|nr:N(4)-(Beta-n-acetylglucosaminyl)-l-asparaginase [Striga asiatica]